MTDLRVVGVDPGPVPGIVVLDFVDDHASVSPTFFPKWRLHSAQALQCSYGLAPQLVESLLDDLPSSRIRVQVERFVAGHRASRSSTPSAGRITRDLVSILTQVVADRHVRVVARSAAAVKPWATDARLEATGLLTVAKPVGRHAVDAARHALFCAVHDGGIPDPLSKKWSAR